MSKPGSHTRQNHFEWWLQQWVVDHKAWPFDPSHTSTRSANLKIDPFMVFDYRPVKMPGNLGIENGQQTTCWLGAGKWPQIGADHFPDICAFWRVPRSAFGEYMVIDHLQIQTPIFPWEQGNLTRALAVQLTGDTSCEVECIVCIICMRTLSFLAQDPLDVQSSTGWFMTTFDVGRQM